MCVLNHYITISSDVTNCWYSALYTPLQHLHSRFPGYMVPGHILLADVTEPALQEAFVWSWNIWASGKFPHLDHRGIPFPANSWRARLAANNTDICGGFTPVYTGTVADQLWIKQHYRYSQMWSNVEMCHECFAQNAVGPLNFTACVEFPPRTNATYMASDGAKMSPLTKVIGFHMSMTRPELMHVGPLGCMPDFVGSALTELADEGFFGFTDVTSWQVRFESQIKVAFIDFNKWARRHNQSHSLKTLTRARLSLHTRSAWRDFKGKAHNCMVLCRWLASVCKPHSGEAYPRMRSAVMSSFSALMDVAGHSEDPDWYNESELKRVDIACNMVLHGSKALAGISHRLGKARWKMRPKPHRIHHVNKNAQLSKRPIRAFWSFKQEEGMGTLSKIATGIHGATVAKRSLQRWCVHFFA